MLTLSKMTSRLRRPLSTTVIVLSALFIFLLIVGLVILSVKFDSIFSSSERTKNEQNLKFQNDGNSSVPVEFVDAKSSSFGEKESTGGTINHSNQKEFVRPIKLVPTFENHFSENENQTLFQHSGNFRMKKAIVWDPHPEYKFEAFGRTFHLVLNQDSSFVHPSLQRELDINPLGCFYSGILKNEPQSSVTVNLCNGMKGHINSESDSYFIEPAEPFVNVTDTFFHVISRSEFNDAIQCEMTESNEFSGTFENIDSNQIPMNSEDVHARSKRSIDSFLGNTMELMVVADYRMKEHHKDDLENYILTLMFTVAKVFKDKSIGNHVNIAVVKLIVLSDDIFGSKSSNTISGIPLADMLENFCVWQKRNNDPNDASPNHHDSALLLTRDFSCGYSYPNKCDAHIGLARLGSICKTNSCAIARESGLATAYTIAHELGHILSLPHDNDPKCEPYNVKETRKRIMYKVMERDVHPWTWSACSRHFLTEFLDSGNGDCLHDDPSNDYLEEKVSNELPGENYSKDHQCELIYGKGYKICYSRDVCNSLWCTESNDEIGCRTNGHPWADGTPCGLDQWCQQRQCVLRDRKALKPVDGGWGSWQPFGECSRSCGGGIERSIRECTDPPPKNGGKFCVGKRVRYRSCNSKECPPGTPNIRHQQCAEFNNNNFNLPHIPKDVRWLPHYYGKHEFTNERCKLYCKAANSQSYYLLKDKVIDGTPCGSNTYDMCVNGICMKAGCDHILDSISVLDVCGICGGNNSTCQQLHKVYDVYPVIYGYNRVCVIPAGASNIDIKQRSRRNQADENYLALMDPDGTYLFNGNFSVDKRFKQVNYDGVIIDYWGSGATVERINISQRLEKDLILEVLSVGTLDSPPTIDSQYTVPIAPEDYFKWNISDEWTSCSKVCNGEQHKIIRCIRKDTRNLVSEESCNGLLKPRENVKPCNQDCVLKWDIISQSECSSHCGTGTRTTHYRCFQEFYDKYYPRAEVPDNTCSHIPKPSENQPCIGTCDNYRWKYDEWSPCNVTCGSGIQTRAAICIDREGKMVSDLNCILDDKITQKRCIMEKKCPIWVTGEWSSCSSTCGTGRRNRSVRCQQENVIVSKSLCSVELKPNEYEMCQLPPCASWLVGEWSSCSVTCGTGVSVRNVWCSASDENMCSNLSKPSIIQSCSLAPCDDDENFKWKAEEWEPCSVACGSGVRRRTIACYDIRFNKQVDSWKCNIKDIPKPEESCFGRLCAEWKTAEWSSCSVTCGKGTRIRSVWCEVSGVQVSESRCSEPKPTYTVICETSRVCFTPTITRSTTTVSYGTWRTGKWGECSTSCGGGHKMRHVVCHNDLGEESTCDPLLKPPSTNECNNEPCPTNFQWDYGKWSECNNTCGGYQHRLARCLSDYGENVSEIYCKEKPELVKPCQNLCPTTFRWVISEWSECSVSCGNGFQKRSVVCRRFVDLENEREIVSESFCPESTRPTTQRECKLNGCGSNYKWRAGNWTECSVPCGKGKQKRKLTCYDNNSHKKVKKLYCSHIKKPNRRRKCQGEKCDPTTCLAIKQQFRTSIDRDYPLLILGRNISIYCHQMTSSNPTEYLTLPTGEQENFSEFFGKRLIKPNTCPENRLGKYYCPCIDEPNVKSGRTVFSKIRLNVANLQVDTIDYTFAKNLIGTSIPFGEAGDCYSTVNCPQGIFSINLRGTGLRISPFAKWKEEGTKAHIKIELTHENRKAVGKCGGHCAVCRPDGGLKLDVLPP